ncbi:MAG: hypothetical protein DMG17_04975, partial [Acidobacteria bacterium]
QRNRSGILNIFPRARIRNLATGIHRVLLGEGALSAQTAFHRLRVGKKKIDAITCRQQQDGNS